MKRFIYKGHEYKAVPDGDIDDGFFNRSCGVCELWDPTSVCNNHELYKPLARRFGQCVSFDGEGYLDKCIHFVKVKLDVNNKIKIL